MTKPSLISSVWKENKVMQNQWIDDTIVGIRDFPYQLLLNDDALIRIYIAVIMHIAATT